MNAQCFQILTDAMDRYKQAEGSTFTHDLMPQETVAEMLAEAIEVALKMDIHKCVDFNPHPIMEPIEVGDPAVDVLGKVPFIVAPFEGHIWLRFHYSENGVPPWKWSEIMLYQGQKYQRMGHDSDAMYVSYKEILDSDIAKEVVT